MQCIKGSVSTTNCHDLICANAVVQAALEIKNNGIISKTDVEVMLLESW